MEFYMILIFNNRYVCEKLNIFNIQRFSLHDGPGIRTSVFLKGCTIRCQWCHNPESIPAEPLVCFYPDKCINCQGCKNACGINKDDKLPVFENYPYAGSQCFECGKCIEHCPANAIILIDKLYEINEAFDICLKDEVFYSQQDNRGGVTFSGGEPLLQAEVLRKLMKRLKESGVHLAIETAGNVDYSEFELVIQYTDLFLYDLKIADSERHRQFTGVPNKKIIQNLYSLAEKTNAEIHIRVPVMEGVNADEENMRGIAKILEPVRDRVSGIELMPYHRFGEAKYKNLKLPPPRLPDNAEFGVPDDSKISVLYGILNE